jgi:L-seryl-tRNA(Ser) seleniumtransferase
MTVDEIGARATSLAAALASAGVPAEIVDGFSTIGGGSAPGSRLPTRLVALRLPADRVETALRAQHPPVIARIENNRVLLDLRTVPADRDRQLVETVAQAARSVAR